ncbi:MAG: repeat containing protein [Verrucomicrobia bacterium]|nr:repeat containing protein [Verrucomicrobiota bacterium]
MKNRSTVLWILLPFLMLGGLARAAVLHFHADLSPANEIPPTVSTGTGMADVYYDSNAHTLQVNITWSGLAAGTTAAHIHAPGTAATIASAVPFNGTWGVATQSGTFTGFPTGVTAGTYTGAPYSLLSTANYTTGYVAANGATGAAAEAALLTYLLTGKTYLNVHTSVNTGGEIKGYLQYVADSTSNTKLINVSSRAQVGSGDGVLIAGFVVGGTDARTVLIRAVGPTLGNYGVTGALADPQLDVTQAVAGVNVVIASNDNWGGSTQVSAAASAVGAFAFSSATSKDAAVLVTLQPGVYSAKASGVGGISGIALIEVYEVP